jgi:hypothetical protein
MPNAVWPRLKANNHLYYRATATTQLPPDWNAQAPRTVRMVDDGYAGRGIAHYFGVPHDRLYPAKCSLLPHGIQRGEANRTGAEVSGAGITEAEKQAREEAMMPTRCKVLRQVGAARREKLIVRKKTISGGPRMRSSAARDTRRTPTPGPLPSRPW